MLKILKMILCIGGIIVTNPWRIYHLTLSILVPYSSLFCFVLVVHAAVFQ